MTRVEQVVRAAQRRRLLRRIVSLMGPALVIGASAALIGALVDRLIGPGLAWWIWLVAPMGLAAVIALVVAFVGRGGPLDAAVEIDTVLRLRDRLGTAMALQGAAEEDAFAALAVEDAEKAAGEVRVERAVPIALGNSWVAWPAVALVAAIVAFFVPNLDLLGAREASASPANDAKRRALVADLEEIVETVDPEPAATPEEAAVADLGKKNDEVLEALSKQLLEGTKGVDEARAEAVEHLNKSAEELAREAEQRALKEQAARELFNQLSAKGDGEGESAADDLREKLASGDMAAAAQAARDLEEEVKRMTPAERRAVAEHLERTAQELEEAAAESERRAEEEAAADREPLEQQGVTPEDAGALQNETDPESIREALEEKGVDPETAERLAAEMARRNAERKAREDAAKEARESAEDMRDILPDLRKPPPQKSGGKDDQAPDERNPSSAPAPAERDPFAPLTPPKAPNAGDKDPANRDPQKSEDEGKRPEERGDPQQPGSPDQNKGSQPSNSGDQQSGGGEDDGEQRDGQQGQPQGGEPSNSPGGVRKGEGEQPSESQDSQGGQPGQSQGETPGQSPSESQTGSGSGAGAGERDDNAAGGGGPQSGNTGGAPARDKLSERLDRMSREAQEAESQRNRAERMREAARELGREVTPGQSNEWGVERTAEEGGAGGEGSDDGERLGGSRPRLPEGYTGTDDVDARRGGEDGRVVHEWSNPDAPIARDGAVSNRPMSEEILEAQESAQKGVEERTIPNRYDPVLRKYFEKALKRAKDAEAEEKKAAPAAAAEDAGGEKK